MVCDVLYASLLHEYMRVIDSLPPEGDVGVNVKHPLKLVASTNFVGVCRTGAVPIHG